MRKSTEKEMLLNLQQATFRYFLRYANTKNGLIPDNTRADAPCSITAVGLALACYPVGVERGYLTRAQAIDITLTTLRFLWQSKQSNEANATGFQGFYYHFLEMESGRRAPDSELSTVDSTFLLAGVLSVGTYFDRDSAAEQEIRSLSTALFERTNWHWALNNGKLVSHGWSPEDHFIPWAWEGYSEALLLYILALASPTFPIPPESYHAWSKTYQWMTLYGHEYLHAAPLFIHQLSHIWVDFRKIADPYMRKKGIDYFENSRRAVHTQQAYAMANPRNFKAYGKHVWGITASDGPGNKTRIIDGIERRFYAYRARGIPHGPDDGTLSPWAVVASLPFAPEIVLPTIEHFRAAYPAMISELGFHCSFNPTYVDDTGAGWISQGYYGLEQGPVVLMIENYLTGFPWRLMRACPIIKRGLQRAGFTGGWLR